MSNVKKILFVGFMSIILGILGSLGCLLLVMCGVLTLSSTAALIPLCVGLLLGIILFFVGGIVCVNKINSMS